MATRIRVIENVEKLSFDAKLHSFAQSEPLRQVKIAPEEIWTAQRVSSQISELALLRTIAAGASASARIHSGNKRVRVEPLNRSGLSHTRDRIVLIERHSWNDTGELRSAPVARCRFRLR